MEERVPVPLKYIIHYINKSNKKKEWGKEGRLGVSVS